MTTKVTMTKNQIALELAKISLQLTKLSEIIMVSDLNDNENNTR